MNDRELLELAAKAFGYQVKGYVGEHLVFFNPITGSAEERWDPLTDDGDAFRLATDLLLRIDHEKHSVHVGTSGDEGEDLAGEPICASIDRFKATRRAIVRAAAAIGAAL